MKIYHAGSLSAPLSDAEKAFEASHLNVDIQREAYGSADAVKQVKDLKRPGDIVAVADYDLIDKRMIPDHADWNLQFARGELVIVYSNESKYKSQINGQNWYQIFRKPDVKFGLSDPNADPCGYRSVMLFQLAESFYNDDNIFDDLIAQNTAMTSETNGTGFVIYAPSNLNPTSKVMIRPKEVDLMQAIESGNLDYLIIYKSIAEQHRNSGARFIELPEKLNLKYARYESEYKQISLVQNSDTDKSKTVTLKPIVYGITVVKNSKQMELALEFVRMMITNEGIDILKKNFQEPITPAVSTVDLSKIPDMLRPYVKQGK